MALQSNLTTDLAFIALEAQRRRDDYEAFCYYVELDKRSDAELDQLVDQVAAPIIKAIDCTACANCCRVLDVYVTEAEANRLAEGAQIPLAHLLADSIDHQRAADVEEWGVFKQKPCRFLAGNLCSVYPHRPEGCRLYPVFTPAFRWTLDDIVGGVGLCPIIYNVIEALQARLGW